MKRVLEFNFKSQNSGAFIFEKMKTIPLIELHKKLGAHLTEFSGLLMPLYYKSIKDEHLCVRNSVGVFDVSHMGEIEIKGKKAKEFANYILTNNILSANYGDVKYTVMCNEDGGIIDDLFSYTFSNERILLVVNAGNTEKDFNWIKKNIWDGLEVKNVSEDIVEFAIQGPRAEELLQRFTDFDLSEIGYFQFKEIEIFGKELLISRTGYTGEDGFEIYMPKESGEEIFKEILNEGKEFGILPCGLGARDTLRFEVCYWLYGNDIDETTNPLESGQKFLIDLSKEDFIGKKALERIKEEGVKRRWRGIEVKRGIARHGYRIIKDGKEIGYITSGNYSFILNKSLALGYIDLPYGKIGEEVEILGKKKLFGKVIKKPFIKPKTKK